MTYVATQTTHTMATAVNYLKSNHGAAKPTLAFTAASKIKVTITLAEKKRALVSAAKVVSVKVLRRAWQWM